MILCSILAYILKLVFKKGHKSHALRLLGILLGVMGSVVMVAYFINYSTEQTNKVSFKAAGIKYKEQYTISEVVTRREETEKHKNSTSSSLTTEIKQPVAGENAKISSDLQVLSSFDCAKSIPTVLLEYVSNTFLNEYGRSHKDFHSQNIIGETLPLLKQLNINCGIDQKCSTLFQYDKPYGVSTTGDKTYVREDVFYCCPSVHSMTNQTISDVCKRAQTIVGKSIFRESKNSTFLGRVITLY